MLYSAFLLRTLSDAATALNAAAVDDVFAWCILAIVLAIIRSSAPITALYTILSTSGVILAMVLVVRPLIAWFFHRLDQSVATEDAIENNGTASKITKLVTVVGSFG